MPAKPHGSGSITLRKDGRWQVAVSVDSKRLYRYAATEAEAETIRKQLVARKHKGKLRPDPPKLKIDALLAQWLASKEPPEVLARAWSVYERRIRLQIAPSIGHLRAADLRPGDVDDWLRMLARADLSETTIRHARSILSEALEWAVDRELVARNVARRVRVPKGRAAAVRTPPTADEARAFLGAVSGHRLAALWHLAAFLGLRRGELLGLTWAAVDLDRATLRVDSQLIREGGAWTLPDPKSGAGKRVLPLVAPLQEMLAKRRVEQLEERLKAPEWGADLGLVFATGRGRPTMADTIRVTQQKLAAAAGVEPIGLHRFRHGVATALLEQDAPQRIVQAFLGHSARSVSDRYQHPTVEMLRPYAERIAAGLRPVTDESLRSNRAPP